MSREIVNQSPTRKTLVTGESLPAITTESRPIPLGRDENGEVDAQVRAFAVLARNRANSPVYISEGPTDDENVIDPGESFQIWEPNGTGNVFVRGDSGGERVEFRTLEAHNDFSITDKIDAFTRALSHFFGTARRTTEITGDVSIGTINDGIDATIIGSNIDVPVSGSVDIGNFADTVEISDITSTSTTFDIDGTVDASGSDITIGDITGQTTTLDIDGTVDASGSDIDVAQGNITVDDITATSATFDGDITGQSNFDLSASVRQGQTENTFIREEGLSEAFNNSLGTDVTEYHHFDLYEPAAYDGTIERVEFRVYDYGDADTAGFTVQVDYGDTGSYEIISPRTASTGRLANRYGADTVRTPRYYPGGEAVIVWEPDRPVRFEEGDSVAVEVAAYNNNNLDDTATYNVEAEIISTLIKTD